MKNSRAFGFIIIAVVYALAIAAGVITFNMLGAYGIYRRIFIADVIATLVVYFAGAIFGNASVYDAYWSVQPIVIVTGLFIHYGNFGVAQILLALAVLFWGVRLTANWVCTFENLNKQDWRYDMFKTRFPRLYPLISLFGIHMFPTVVVYFAVLPAVIIAQTSTVNIFTFLGFVISFLAAFLQLFADMQMHSFRKNEAQKGTLIRGGLWQYSRHPNYLGEILMWWGVYVIMLSVAPTQWAFGLGALANTIMFLVVSIPMAEKRNSERIGYAQYKKETRALLPIKRKD